VSGLQGSHARRVLILGKATRLAVAYDEPFVEWHVREMSAVRSRGTLVRRLLRRDDRVLRWYVAYLKPRRLSHVVDVTATKGHP
jgi:hypothetical protein